MPKQTIKSALCLKPGDTLLAVRCDVRYGPGWGNSPIWAYVKRAGGGVTEECIQPEAFNAVMEAMHEPCRVTHDAMMAQIRKELETKKKGRS
jgi:hypothetical protein